MPNYYNPYPQQYYQPQPQIQDVGFVIVPNEDVVPTYPVGMGKTVYLKIDGKPVMYEKMRSFSQFEAPTVKRLRLIEDVEEEDVKEATPENVAIDSIQGEIKHMWKIINNLEARIQKPVNINKKREVRDDTE